MVYHARLDTVFGALADRTRREILTRLASGDRTISELAGGFDMSLPAVSKHIRVLQRAGLVRVRREGRSRRTTLVARPMRDALGWIEGYRRFWEFQFDQLSAFLEETAQASANPDVAGEAGAEEGEWHRPSEPQAKESSSSGSSRRRGRASSRPGRGRNG
jgi:DNA-binding transcriptional ArsR family regulator